MAAPGFISIFLIWCLSYFGSSESANALLPNYPNLPAKNEFLLTRTAAETFEICCQKVTSSTGQVALKPSDASQLIFPIQARVLPSIYLAPSTNAATNLPDAFYTVLMSRQNDTAEGTVNEPLLHWMVINVPYKGEASPLKVNLEKGETVLSYKPPYSTDRKIYQYTFFVYRQQNGRITKPADNFASLANAACTNKLGNRFYCSFKQASFVSQNALSLVAASWMLSSLDGYGAYQNYKYNGQSVKDACRAAFHSDIPLPLDSKGVLDCTQIKPVGPSAGAKTIAPEKAIFTFTILAYLYVNI